MANLDQFIIENRSEFDQIEAPDHPELLWEKISADLEVTDTTSEKIRVVSIFSNRYIQWAIAASFGLLIGLSTWIFYPNQGQNLNGSLRMPLAELAPQLADREQGYIELISNKEAEININEIDPSTYQDLFNELKALDELRDIYLKDLDQALGSEQYIQTLIRFYERKINLLNRLSLEIKKNQKHKELREVRI